MTDVENVDKFLEISRNQLESMKDKVKRCNMLGVIDSYFIISTNLQNAAQIIPDLPPALRDEKMKEVHRIHDKKHEIVKTINDFCRCEAKTPYRYVKAAE
jgi:hypothetical protein